MSASLPLGPIENALRAWVLAGSGLPDASVAWQDGGAPRPTLPFIALQLEIATEGRDSVSYTVNDASNGHDGHELDATVRGNRKGTLTLQAFALPDQSADADAVSSKAAALLAEVITAKTLPSVRAALKAANIGVASFGPVQLVGGRVANMTTFEPRAVLVVTLNLRAQTSEAATCIDSASVGVHADGDSDPTFTATA